MPPFLANVFAHAYTNCTEYLAHPELRQGESDCKSIFKPDGDRTEKLRSQRRQKQPTQMDLVPKITMVEIFSSSPIPPHISMA
jgi:hypothetical protein